MTPFIENMLPPLIMIIWGVVDIRIGLIALSSGKMSVNWKMVRTTLSTSEARNLGRLYIFFGSLVIAVQVLIVKAIIFDNASIYSHPTNRIWVLSVAFITVPALTRIFRGIKAQRG